MSKEDSVFQHQADSVTIIANPVSLTKYGWLAGASGAGAALGTQKRVRIISILAKLDWGVTQPTPLVITVTVDGHPLIFTGANPVSATNYFCQFDLTSPPASGGLTGFDAHSMLGRSSWLEGRSVKIEVAVTWATTQPTDLTMRVQWARIP